VLQYNQFKKMAHSRRSSQFSAWLVPLSYAAAAVLTGFAIPRLGAVLLPGFLSTISVAAAIGIYSAVASGMIALTGIVFSLTFLMVQFSAAAYSPRLVLWIARDPVMSHALGVFTATFLYALTALAWVDRNGSGKVPLVGVVAVAGCLYLSTIMFISLIQRVGMLQVNRMLIFTGDQGRKIIENLYPPIETPASPSATEKCNALCLQTLFHYGRPQHVQAIDVPVLLQLANQAGCVIEMVAAVGDTVFDSTPLLRIMGGTVPFQRRP
jgi:uncharacterized membrane protein